VLADSYAPLSLTHLAHWNVEGPGFFALHTAFQTQYEELFIAIDAIASGLQAQGAGRVPSARAARRGQEETRRLGPFPQRPAS